MATINASERKEKLKQMGLFQLWKEIFIGRRQTRRIEALNFALENNLASLREVTDFTLALRYLDESEELINRAKLLLSQMKERQKRLFEEPDPQRQREEIIAQSQLEEISEFVSGLKLIIKILLEGKTQEDVLDKMGDLISWLGFENPQVNLFVTEETIDQDKWKVITIESTEFRAWDDLPANIRRRRSELKGIFERAGAKYYYQASPAQGTMIKLMVPQPSKLEKSYE